MPTTAARPATTDGATDTATDGATDGADDRICAACPHVRDAHDPLGRRFCAATTASAANRGCICTGDALLPAPGTG
jgi:hypothetical protein